MISLVKKKPIELKKKSGHITNIKIISTEANQPKEEINSIKEERCKTETNDIKKVQSKGRAITKIEFIKNKYRALCNNITL